MTGYLRIGGALILGVLIILVAFVVAQRNSKSTATVEGKLEIAPGRTYIETSDSDGDGIADWEESFNDRIFAAIESPTSSASTTYEAPTTFTGKFAEAFFEDYMQGKMNGADYTDPTEFVNDAVKAIDSSTKSKTYTRLDIQVVPDSTRAISDYGNALAAIIKRDGTSNPDAVITIMEKAVTNSDQAELAKLEPIKLGFEKIVTDIRTQSVPQSMVSAHLSFLNAAQAVHDDIATMELSFTDPLYALARVRSYKDDVGAFFTSFVELARAITNTPGVTFAPKDSGSYLYLFNI